MKKQIFVKSSGEFSQYINAPLVADDVLAYEIVFDLGQTLTSGIFSVTAARADGITITDVGTVSGSVATYTIRNNMYAIEGELRLRLTITQDGSVLTSKELICTVVSANGEADISADDRAPALSSLIIQASQSGAYANAQGDFAQTQGAYAKTQGDRFANSKFAKTATIVIGTTSENADQLDYICDGTNDGAIINQAIQSLINGGKVILREGTYVSLYGSQIIMSKSNVTLEGMGTSTIIQGYVDGTAETTNTVIRNIKFSYPQINIYNHALIENCYFCDDGDLCPIFVNGNYNIVRNCYFDESIAYSIPVNTGYFNQFIGNVSYIRNGFLQLISGTSNSYIANNHIFVSSGGGISVSGSTDFIMGNMFFDNGVVPTLNLNSTSSGCVVINNRGCTIVDEGSGNVITPNY